MSAEDRVQAAANALARQWATNPADTAAVHKLAKTLRHDAWVLENAGLLKDPT